jgi:hypothetical protein
MRMRAIYLLSIVILLLIANVFIATTFKLELFYSKASFLIHPIHSVTCFRLHDISPNTHEFWLMKKYHMSISSMSQEVFKYFVLPGKQT